MKQIIGFIPSNPNQNHLRVKNLTGSIIETTNDKVIANFTILVNTKEEIMRLEYPLDECKKYYVSIDHIKKNGLTFHQFCKELNGFDVYLRGSIIHRWELFWSGVTTQYIFSSDSIYTLKDKPSFFSLTQPN
jgi:hypothetical protein